MISRAISSTGVEFVVNDVTMRVDDGAPIALPFRPLVIRAGRDELVCVPGDDLKDNPEWGGKTYLIRSTGEPIIVAPWRARGNNSVAISDDGSRVWLIGRESAQYYTWQASSGLEGPFDTPNPDNHIGFAVTEPTLRMHVPSALSRLGNVTLRFPLKLWLDLGPWLFGEHKDVWYAYRKADGAWFVVYDGPVTYPHTARLIDGQFVAAVNGAKGGFIRESALRRVSDPITSDPVPMPLPATCRPHWTAMDGWDGEGCHLMPGNLQWGAPKGDTRDAYDGMPDATRFDRLTFLVLGTDGGRLPSEAEVQAAVEERNRRTPDPILTLYSDVATWNTPVMKKLVARVRKFTSRYGRNHQCYPKKGQTTAQRMTVFRTEITEARKAKKRVVVTSAAYEVVPGRPDLTEELTPHIAQMVEDNLDVIHAHVVFGGQRDNAIPSVVDYYRRHWKRMKTQPPSPSYSL